MRIHLRLYRLKMRLEILNDLLLNGPSEEVQLAHCRDKGRDTRSAEHDTLPPAKGIKELLAVRLQLALVIHVDHELLATQEIADRVALSVVRHEPIYQSQTDGRRAL